MSDCPLHNDATLDGVNEIMRRAARQLVDADQAMAEAEAGQRKVFEYVDQLVAAAEDLQIKCDAWRHAAEALEIERNRWRALAEENARLLRIARRRASELAYQAGGLHCPECGSASVVLLHGSFPTGVTAPDGGLETWWESALDCQECGHKEELVP